MTLDGAFCAREERRRSGSSQQCRVNRVDANTTGDSDGAQRENTVGKDFLHLQRAKVTWGSPSASERRDSIVHIIFKVFFLRLSARGRGWNAMSWKVPSNPSQSGIP